MKKIIIFFLVMTITGCIHYYYAPNAANIPLFKEKNIFKGKAGYGGGENYNGGDIQLAYSSGKKVGIMFNAFFAGNTENVQETNSSSSHKESGKGSYVETGIGYYKPFGAANKWIFETYGGAGVGGENHTYKAFQTSRLSISKLFIQPSLGISTNDGHFEAAIGSRFARLNLKIKQNNVSSDPDNEEEKQQLDFISTHPSSLLWEPSGLVAGGWRNFKFFLEYTATLNMTNPELAQDTHSLILGIKFSLKSNPDKNQKE